MIWFSAIISIMMMGFQSSEDIVWHWFSQCPQSDTLQIEVWYLQKIIYRVSVPICAMDRGTIAPEKPQKILEFFFQANCRIFGSEFKRFGSQRIEGNIWEAGKDPHDIILGVSFECKERILLNSVHIAELKKIAKTTMAKGLFVKTYLLHKKNK
jgi:hypothetical protein